MNKTVIKKFAIEARKKLIASVTDKAGMLGISQEGVSEPVNKGTDFEVYKTVAGTEVTLNKKQCEQRKKLADQIEARGFEPIVEEVAYTWFNRICAIRFMEVNDYLPSRVRVLSSEKEGKNEPDVVTQAPEVDLDFTDKEKEYIIDCKMNSKLDELFVMLFIKQCNKLHEVLPELFEETSDYTEMLLDISYTDKDDIIRMLIDDVAEDDFNITSTDEEGNVTGQVEIIGWLYQYYISEKHDQIVNIYKGTVKKEDIPAATQLFTTDWVVRYMVDNSLGRYWIERNPESKLAEKLTYFVKPKSGEIQYVDEKIDPTELTFFDPCMGSGHILVYAFDVLMEIYRECGYSDRDAALNIVQFNLFGVDIDKRAYQLSYFAVMMKARSYNRRALTQGVFNNVAAMEESNTIEGFECEGFTNNTELNKIGNYLVNVFLHAREIGSLQTVEENDYKSFIEYLLNLENSEIQLNWLSADWIQRTQPLMMKLTKQAAILSRKYTVVCTNPPYMNKMESHLKKFVVDNYKDYSGDLFSVFIYRNFDFCVKDGYSAFMTPFVWMFIKTYEKLRKYIIDNKAITSLIQMEYSAFEEATVPICSFILKNGKETEKGLYIRLSDFKGGMEVQKQKVLEGIKEEYCKYLYATKQDILLKIPGSPIAYWVSENFIAPFEEGRLLKDISDVKAGITTADNNRFLRLWPEVNYNTIEFNQTSQGQLSSKRWFITNKGGAYRKWYGNDEYIVDWENDGQSMKNYKGSTIRNRDFYFKECITWSNISSGNAAFRYKREGFIANATGPSIYSQKNLKYFLALCNCIYVEKILNILAPTIHFEVGQISNIPILLAEEYSDIVESMVDENIENSRQDWDSFETSWDFKKHPLVKTNLISESYSIWQQLCTDRFEALKANEEKLNNIFIDIYGVKKELTEEVLDKDVTIRKADLQRDIRSLLSYAVGSMFGRYSLDEEGLIYAGGEWDDSKYNSFIPDEDNIIPITDDEYFSDDIVGRFCEWLKVVYGEVTLEENLEFIADALGNKGSSSREVIRNYFMKDFIADHMKVYQKRPIYWLFESGKENGFKALIYMHRYNQDTVGIVRTDYLHKTQKVVEQARVRAEYTVENASTGTDKAQATKLITKYTKQLAEMKNYDEAMAHIANQRIAIDLDDGVKVNYEKFQGVEVAQEGKKALKIDLLTKIK